MAGSCPYRALGLERGCADAEVKAAFRRAALESHPDRAPAGEGARARARRAEAFRQAAEAYEVLGDPKKRARYDCGERPGAGAGGSAHYYSRRSSPWDGGGARARRPPPSGYEALWARLARALSAARSGPRVSMAEALALAGAAGAALAGLAVLDRGADALWAAHNRGKRFEDIPGRRGPR